MKQDLIKNISLDVWDSWDSDDKKEACGSYNAFCLDGSFFQFLMQLSILHNCVEYK